MNYLSVRTRSRIVCAAGTLLGLTFLLGSNLTQAQARTGTTQAASVTATSVSAPTQFSSGDNISVSVGLSGGSAQVHVTSLPAGLIDYTTTVSDSTPFTVPTSTTVSGASQGDTVSVTIKVTVGTQTIATTSDVTATRTDLEPIFPKPATASTMQSSASQDEASEDTDLEPIFPKPTPRDEDTDLEPIFPKPSSASVRSDLEPIFPKYGVAAYTDLEPIFPKPSTMTDLEPIFPKPVAMASGSTQTDLEPIFPKPVTATDHTDLEPIFPKPVTATAYSVRFRPVTFVGKAY